MSWSRFLTPNFAAIQINNDIITSNDGTLNVDYTPVSSGVPHTFTAGALSVNPSNINIGPDNLYIDSNNIYTSNGPLSVFTNNNGNIFIQPDNSGTTTITKLVEPTNNQDPATKHYVDTALSSLSSPLKVQTFISNANILNLHNTTQTLITAVSGKVFNIISIRFFTYPDLTCSGNIVFYNGTTPINWTLPATVMTCSTQNNVSYAHPISYSTVPNTDFKVGASSAFTGSGTTYFTILYTLSNSTSTYD